MRHITRLVRSIPERVECADKVKEEIDTLEFVEDTTGDTMLSFLTAM